MIAEIIAVGSEMLTPFRQDTNSLYLTAGLNDLGVTVAFKTIVGDNFEHLAGAARTAFERADLVLFSGGLGPTEDDLTREAVSRALGLSLHPDPAIITSLYKLFAERRIAMPPNNAKQADVLEGATLLDNRNGSAPGQILDTTVDSKRRIILLLPGPPKELKPMFDEQVKPLLQKSLPPRFLARRQLRPPANQLADRSIEANLWSSRRKCSDDSCLYRAISAPTLCLVFTISCRQTPSRYTMTVMLASATAAGSDSALLCIGKTFCNTPIQTANGRMSAFICSPLWNDSRNANGHPGWVAARATSVVRC